MMMKMSCCLPSSSTFPVLCCTKCISFALFSSPPFSFSFHISLFIHHYHTLCCLLVSLHVHVFKMVRPPSFISAGTSQAICSFLFLVSQDVMFLKAAFLKDVPRGLLISLFKYTSFLKPVPTILGPTSQAVCSFLFFKT